MKAIVLKKKGEKVNPLIAKLIAEEKPIKKDEIISLEAALAKTKKDREGKEHFMVFDRNTMRDIQESRKKEAKKKKTKFKNKDRDERPYNKGKRYTVVHNELLDNLELIEKGEKKVEAKKREVTPFGLALRTARKITTRKPREEQPTEYNELVDALRKLDSKEKTNLFFRLAKEVLEEKSPLEGLFAVAFKTGNGKLAHHVAAIRKAMLVGKLEFENLVKSGLAEVRTIKDKPRTIYRIGKKAIEEAILKLVEMEENKAARILAEHLRTSNRMDFIAKQKREAKKKTPDVKPEIETLSENV